MLDNLIKWFYRKWALRGLRAKYRKEIAVDLVLKEWITACIIERKMEGRRKELIDSQNKIKEEELFYKWLIAQK